MCVIIRWARTLSSTSIYVPSSISIIIYNISTCVFKNKKHNCFELSHWNFCVDINWVTCWHNTCVLYVWSVTWWSENFRRIYIQNCFLGLRPEYGSALSSWNNKLKIKKCRKPAYFRLLSLFLSLWRGSYLIDLSLIERVIGPNCAPL